MFAKLVRTLRTTANTTTLERTATDANGLFIGELVVFFAVVKTQNLELARSLSIVCSVCVCACVRACVRVRVCVCVTSWSTSSRDMSRVEPVQTYGCSSKLFLCNFLETYFLTS